MDVSLVYGSKDSVWIFDRKEKQTLYIIISKNDSKYIEWESSVKQKLYIIVFKIYKAGFKSYMEGKIAYGRQIWRENKNHVSVISKIYTNIRYVMLEE